MMAIEDTTPEPFHVRIDLADEHNEDTYRDISISAPAPDEVYPTVAINVSSIGCGFHLYVTPAQALEIGRAIVTASGLDKPDAKPTHDVNECRCLSICGVGECKEQCGWPDDHDSIVHRCEKHASLLGFMNEP
jgi:hypothetical protein